MEKVRAFLSTFIMICFPISLIAQASITGSVTDKATGEALPGANIVIEGTALGAAANADGAYAIDNVPAGTQTVTASVIGYVEASKSVNVPSSGSVTVNFALEVSAIELSALEVLAWRATRETPVAFTNVEKEDMEVRLGSRDIPLVLNTTPSVYATAQGGGAGDARVNVRGFNQRNVAIMINGVPVNDMENAWLYWSNWDGLGDATSSIQVQRGLSAVNLATPSIGGSMNIISDPAALRRGLKFKQEVGSWGFLKSTLAFNTGLIMNDKLALTGTLVKKTGDGYYKGTWTDAYSFYFGSSYALNEKNRFELYAIGAPQRHGQNLYKQNIATYSEEFAKSLDDYDAEAIGAKYGYNEAGRDFNQNWEPVSGYTGKQYWAMYMEHKDDDRFDKSFLNERENFFHKPQVNLNWYSTLADNMRLSSVLYWSGGHGGGTGTYGSLVRNPFDPSYSKFYHSKPWTWDWDATIAINKTNIDSTYSTTEHASKGILRNSRNNQWTIGAISKLHYDLSDEIKFIAGIDWRTAEIDHFREVRDLLGGDYYVYTGNEFDTTPESQMKRLGDKIAYYFTNTVDWLGVFSQGEYSSGPITAYGMFGWSQIAYTYTNHFRKGDDGKELFSDPPAIGTTQFKGGVSYRVLEGLGVFGNFGIVEKPPIFDHVIDDYAGVTNDNPVPEKFTSFEGGVYYSGLGGMLNVNANYYNTQWNDRTYTISQVDLEGKEGLINLTGVDALHSGIELEASLQPISLLRLDGSISMGDWHYTDDVSGTYRPDLGVADFDTFNFYIKDLKVGNQPQTAFVFVGSVFPIEGLMAQFVLKMYKDHYADWDPSSRTELEDLDGDGVATDRPQSWKVPDYNLVDFHLAYNLPIDLGGVKLQAFVHIFNLLDEEYIQDAVDNSRYNAWDGDHDADDAEVFFGLPRSFNAGITVNF